MSALKQSFDMSGMQAVARRMDGVARSIPLRPAVGRVGKVSGTIVEAIMAKARLGEICALEEPGAGMDEPRYAEVVGFRDGVALLGVIGEMSGLSARTRVTPTGVPLSAPADDRLLGRVLDGLGRPLDAARNGVLRVDNWRPAEAPPPDALGRLPVSQPMPLGIPAIDSLNVVGEGQRVGLFGEPGTGKSTFVSALAKAASADVAVIAMVGERGREVTEFIEDALGPEGLAKSVLVVATSDRPAMERIKAPFIAAAIAEHFRDQGKRVLFLMDSLTRLARAQREIGLAAGEPPARRAFPPSVFAMMPKLIERAGVSPSGGSITGFYTVLVEDDGVGDPIAEEARSLLDGHVVLSRKLAEAGKFPAIDVLASRSRVMTRVVDAHHSAAADRLRSLMARYDDVELLVRMGEYAHGSDPFTDEAIAKKDRIDRFLHHSLDKPESWTAIRDALIYLASPES